MTVFDHRDTEQLGEHSARRENPPETCGSYIYLATRGVETSRLDRIRGLADRPVRIVSSSDLQGVVSSVDLAEFGEEGLKRNLEDLAWLDRTARAHDQVIRDTSALGTVAPFRLATIVYDDERVIDLLQAWSAELSQTLARVEDRWEWGLKIIVDPAQRSAPEGEAPPDSGAAYLRRRKSERDRQEIVARELAASADRIHEQLIPHADASRRLPAQDRQLAGHTGEMILNSAYLVHADRAEDFVRCVEQLRQKNHRLTLQLVGPWPPYSFATVEPQVPR